MSDSPAKLGRGPRIALVVLIGALALLMTRLLGCFDGPVIAKLIEVRGPSSERDFDASRYTWEPAQVGATFMIGDGVRTLSDTGVRLALIDKTQLELAQRTTIRFLLDGEEQVINIEDGQVSVRAGQADYRLRTQLGLAILRAGSEITLTKSGEHIIYDVSLGSAQFRSAAGEDVVLKAGDRVEVGIGMAIFSREDVEATIGDAVIIANVRSSGVRVRTAGGTEWVQLEQGEHEIDPGTEMRLQRKDLVELQRGDERATLRNAGEYVIGVEQALLDARIGEFSVQAQTTEIHLLVPGGTIQVHARPDGSEAGVVLTNEMGTLYAQKGGSALNVLGSLTELEAVSQKSWVFNPSTSERPIENSASYFNLAVRAGESFVVHSPEVPTAVRFDFAGRCPGEGVIELTGTKQRVRGKDYANVIIAATTTPYLLRCFDDKGALAKKVITRGTAQIMQDAGTRRLPSKAPTSFVETDGRTYTIYYQNQLPEVSVSWPNAPQTSTYELIVDGQSIKLNKAEHLFRSGALRDGNHQLTFQAQDRRSRSTSVEVRFDNAAPKASLTSPIDRSFKPGDTVTIEGVALETWKVSVEGGSITMNTDARFMGEVASKEERPDVAVRLSHPRLGVHYYLRRAAGSP